MHRKPGQKQSGQPGRTMLENALKTRSQACERSCISLEFIDDPVALTSPPSLSQTSLNPCSIRCRSSRSSSSSSIRDPYDIRCTCRISSAIWRRLTAPFCNETRASQKIKKHCPVELSCAFRLFRYCTDVLGLKNRHWRGYTTGKCRENF